MNSGGTTDFLCDDAEPGSPALADTNATCTPVLTERRGGVSRFYHADALGSTRTLTDSAPAPTGSFHNDAFGQTLSRSGSPATPFG